MGVCILYVPTYISVIGMCTFLYICYTSVKRSLEKHQVAKPGKRVHFSDEGKKNFTHNSYFLWSLFV